MLPCYSCNPEVIVRNGPSFFSLRVFYVSIAYCCPGITGQHQHRGRESIESLKIFFHSSGCESTVPEFPNHRNTQEDLRAFLEIPRSFWNAFKDGDNDIRVE